MFGGPAKAPDNESTLIREIPAQFTAGACKSLGAIPYVPFSALHPIVTLSTRRHFIKRTAALTGSLGCAATCGWPLSAGEKQVGSDALERLRTKLKGRLILPGDSTYESARRVFYWNPRTERIPAAIVQCGHEEDVARAVEFARHHGLEVAVRAGGHSHLAWGSSNGVVIDLSPLKQISIDANRRIVRAQAGVLSGEVARAAGRHGLVPVLGQCPGVGATGLTLGGGLGWLSGLFGACCDNLLSARLITADARTLDVNGETDPSSFGLSAVPAQTSASRHPSKPNSIPSARSLPATSITPFATHAPSCAASANSCTERPMDSRRRLT